MHMQILEEKETEATTMVLGGRPSLEAPLRP